MAGILRGKEVILIASAGLAAIAGMVYFYTQRTPDSSGVAPAGSGVAGAARSGNGQSASQMPGHPDDSAWNGDGETAAALDKGYRVVENAGWQARRAFFLVYAKRDPAGTAGWALNRLAHGGDRTFILANAMNEWVKLDSSAAFAWADGIKDAADRAAVLRAYFDVFVILDPKVAAQRLEKAGPFAGRDLVLAALAYTWASKDLSEAVQWVMALSEKTGRTQALTGIVKWLQSSGKVPAVIGAAKAVASREEMIRNILAMLPEDRREKAAEKLSKLPGGIGVDPVLQLQMAKWASQSTNEVFVWASQWSDLPRADEVLALSAEALAGSAPELAVLLVQKMTTGRLQLQTARRVAETWAVSDPSAAAAWEQNIISTAPASESADPAFVPNISEDTAAPAGESTAGETDTEVTVPADVYSWSWSELIPLVEKLPDGRLRDGLIYKAAVEWARDPEWDPSSAADWCLQQLNPGTMLDMTLRVITWDWANKDANAATEWANAQEDSYRKDHALSTISMALARTDPSSAAGMVVVITDENIRRSAVGNLSYRWALIDSAAATSWAQSLVDAALRDFALQKIQESAVRGD